MVTFTCREAVIHLLKENKEGLTSRELFNIIDANKMCPRLKGATPSSTISTQCLYLFNDNHIKRNEEVNPYRYYIEQRSQEISQEKLLEIKIKEKQIVLLMKEKEIKEREIDILQMEIDQKTKELEIYQ